MKRRLTSSPCGCTLLQYQSCKGSSSEFPFPARSVCWTTGSERRCHPLGWRRTLDFESSSSGLSLQWKENYVKPRFSNVSFSSLFQYTYVLHKKATGNTEKRGTNVGNTAVIGPANLPSQNLWKAFISNTNYSANSLVKKNTQNRQASSLTEWRVV